MHFIKFGVPGCMCGFCRKVGPKIISLPGRLTLFPALMTPIIKCFAQGMQKSIFALLLYYKK